jgi:hypothetical protein
MTMIISGDNGLTYPNSTVQASAGVVLQVVQAIYNTTTTVGTTTPTTIFSASITPKFSTSKILVVLNLSLGINPNSNALYGVISQVLRGATAIYYSDRSLALYTSTTAGYVGANCSISVLDSPATTSSTTYTYQMAPTNTAGSTSARINDYTTTTPTNGSSITLMEIAA